MTGQATRYTIVLITGLAGLASATLPMAAPKADLWSFWEAHDPDSITSVNHTPWQTFLDSYLVQSADGVNRVNYAVTAADRAALLDYLEQLERLDPRTLNRSEQLAYWINLYNAMTVEVVLRHPNKGSILRMGKGLFSIGPWNDPVFTIAGESVTLNDVEHRILRPIWRDHRIHYAVNCASIGCPNLSPLAYTSANAEAQLEAGEQDYLSHPRGVSFTANGKLRISSIFKWYQVDFADSKASLIEYLAGQHATLGERLATYDGGIDYRYDWNLNRAEP